MKKIRSLFKHRFQTGDTVLGVLFIISLISAMWMTDIYRITVIGTRYLIALSLSGVALCVILFSVIFKSGYSAWMTFLPKACIGSVLACMPVLFFNQQLADDEILTEDVAIIEKGSFARGKYSSCEQPFVIIELDGEEKQLPFYCSAIVDVRKSSKVRIRYSKGLFGFWVIRSGDLME